MTRTKFLAAAAMLSALVATPAFAQHMIEEPGMFAFYHPNGDLGIASTPPAANAMASGSLRNNGNVAGLRMHSRSVAARRTHVVRSN